MVSRDKISGLTAAFLQHVEKQLIRDRNPYVSRAGTECVCRGFRSRCSGRVKGAISLADPARYRTWPGR